MFNLLHWLYNIPEKNNLIIAILKDKRIFLLLLLLFRIDVSCMQEKFFYIIVFLPTQSFLLKISSKASWFLFWEIISHCAVMLCLWKQCVCPREVRSEHKTSSAMDVNCLPDAPLCVLYNKSHELRHRNFVAHIIYKNNLSHINEIRKI